MNADRRWRLPRRVASTGRTRVARPSARGSMDAAVLWRGVRSAAGRVLSTGEELAVQAPDLWHVVPGHVVTLALDRRWRQDGRAFAAGELREPRVDVRALGLPRLQL